MTARSPSKTMPEILIPPPFSFSDLSNSEKKPQSFNDGNSSIKTLLEKSKKKDISEFFDELKTSLNNVSNSIKPIKKKYLRNWSNIEERRG